MAAIITRAIGAATCVLALAVGCTEFGSATNDAPPRPADDDSGAAAMDAGPDLPDAGHGDGSGPPPTDAGDAAPVGCMRAAACERVVFVTREAFPATVVATGDQLCTNAAATLKAHARVKGRKFQAWFSLAGSSAAERLVHGTRTYRRTDDTEAAGNWNDLISNGSPDIASDEEGKGMGLAAVNVWTGTSNTGGSAALNCVNWTVGNDRSQAVVGTPGGDAVTWTQSMTTLACDQTAHLYCFEE